MIRAGALRHCAIVQEAVRSIGTTGVPTVTYEDIDTVKCSITSTRGSVAETYRQISPQSTHVVKMRYYKHIKADDRLVINSVAYDIDHVDNVKQMNRWLEVLVHEQDRP